jgi:hypothetical protein
MLVIVLTSWMMMMELLKLQNMEDLLLFLAGVFGWYGSKRERVS